MSAPTVRELVNIPTGTEEPEVFDQKAFNLMDQLAAWTGDVNALSQWINENVNTTVLNAQASDTGFTISTLAPDAEGGPRRYALDVRRNPGTQFAPLVKVSSIGTDEDEDEYFDEEVVTESSSLLTALNRTPQKDYHSAITVADGINIHSRLWVNTQLKIATLNFVIKGFATSSIDGNLETISDDSNHGIDNLIDTGSGLFSSSAKLIIPLYSNQGFTIGSIPSIVGAIKIDGNANAWINLNSGADFSTGQSVTVQYKIK